MKAENGLKKCSKCGEVKGVEEFGKRKVSLDGFMGICRVCINKHRTKWRNENKASFNSKRRELYLKNKDIVKLYREKIKDYTRSYMIQYRAVHKDDIKEYNKLYSQNNAEKKRARWHRWSGDNKDKIYEYRKESIANLTDSYVARAISNTINMSIKDIMKQPELIETKRTILKTKRLCKTLKNSEVN